MTDPISPANLAAVSVEGELIFLPQHNWGWFLLRGLLAIAVGIAALFEPGITAIAIAMIFAGFSLADGIFSLIAGVRGATHHTQRWGAFVVSGLIGIAVGAFFFIWPVLASAAYAFVLIAILSLWAIVTGILELAAAIRLRKEMEGEWLLGRIGHATLGWRTSDDWLLGIWRWDGHSFVPMLGMVAPTRRTGLLLTAWLPPKPFVTR